MMTQALIWKLTLGCALGAAIALSVKAPAPRLVIAPRELRRLVASALGLYAVGAVAWLTHHAVVAGLVYACGITVCTLAAWLSRGSEPEDPPELAGAGEEPPDGEHRPSGPTEPASPEWEAFERAFRTYAERTPARAR